MKQNEFKPFVGLYNIKFGIKRSIIRIVLKDEEYKIILRNQFAVNTTDYYPNKFYFIQYDEKDECESIEFTKGSNLYIEECDLFLLSYSHMRLIFDKKSNHIEIEDDVGVTYHDLGFSVTKDVESQGVETVMIFRKGYWDI